MKVTKLLFQLTLKKSLTKYVNKCQEASINFRFNSRSLNFEQKFQFATIQSQQQVFNKDTEEQLYKKEIEYRATQNINIFESTIKNSTGLLDQMIIYKIFKVMEGCPFNIDTYTKFYETVDEIFKKKSDNMLLLLASIKKKIGENYKKQKSYENALKCYQQALDILENAMVPPLLPYYSIYRQYGLLHDILGEQIKAKEILIESVDILDHFVSHSDDNVSTNDFSKKQASAYNALARIDSENRNKWIEKANEAWKVFADQRFNQIEYAKTVALNIKKLLKQDKEKGEAYYNFNLYKFEKKQLKDILKKAKQESM